MTKLKGNLDRIEEYDLRFLKQNILNSKSFRKIEINTNFGYIRFTHFSQILKSSNALLG